MSSLYVIFESFTECIIPLISKFYAHCKYFIQKYQNIRKTKIDDWNERRFGHIAKCRSQRMILDDTLTQDTLA